MFGSSVQIGRIFGIKIHIDLSWILIFLLVAWNLTSVFGTLHPDWSLTLRIGTAIVAAILFFGSVLAHELAHSLMAVAQGLPVRNIILFLFGGVSNIEREPPSPRVEFLIAIVGPLTSILLGVLFYVLFLVTANVSFADGPMSGIGQFIDELGPISTLLLWLAPINIILGIFNMVPGFPLDGGRVLRSILWAIIDNLRQATRWASWVGQGIAWLMIVAGIAMVFGAEIPFFGTGVVSGLWLAFIGWFLNNAAVQSYQQVVIQDLLDDVPVGQIMRRNPPVVSPDITIGQLVYEKIMGSDDHAFPVVNNGELLGLICLHDIRAIDRERWETTTVREVMTPREKLVTTTPNEGADEALNKLQRQDHRQLPVVENNHLVGLLRRGDIIRWLQLQAGDEGVSRRAVPA